MALEKKRRTRRTRRRDNPRREMTFLEHLDELRGRLIICALAIVLTTLCLGAPLSGPMLDMLFQPFYSARNVPQDQDMLIIRIAKDGSVRALNATDFANLSDKWVKIVFPDEAKEIVIGPGTRDGLIATTLIAPIILTIKAAIILGIIFAMPIWLYQAWLFIAPAMTTVERRAVRPVLWAGIVLFPTGAAFAYFMFNFLMPVFLTFAKKISPEIMVMPDIQKYVGFVLNFMLAFGLVFETPLVLVLLVRMGVVSVKTLRKSRPYTVVIIFVLAAVLTPSADPFGLLSMALPMLLLFEISLWVSGIVERKVEAAERALAQSS